MARSWAVALSGGGIVGLAWELGVVEGLRTSGVEVAHADQVIGTSAGSIVGVLPWSAITLNDLPSRVAELAPELIALMLPVDQARVGRLTERWMAAGALPSRADRLEILGLAASAPTVPEAEYVDVVRRLLPVRVWPAPLQITAVAVDDGEPAAWGASSGVELATAIAASTALPGVFPPITIDGRRYVDGGLRSPASIDLAAGRDVVVVLVPSADPSIRRYLDTETSALRSGGTTLVEVLPDPAAAEAIGPDFMDIGRFDTAVRAGLRQGRDIAPAVAALLGSSDARG